MFPCFIPRKTCFVIGRTVIPTYNRIVQVQQAINSVLAQTYQDIEVVVVDDGSFPHQRLQKAQLVNPLIKYFYRPHRGVAAARNFGAAVANGQYLAFLDSDDLWDKRKLEKQLAFLRGNPDIKVCHTDETWIRNGEHLNQLKKHAKSGGWIFEQCLPLCLISPSSIVMEKNVFTTLGGFDERFPVCEDYDLWLRLTLHYQVGYLDEKLVTKRGGQDDQLSRKYWGMDRFRIRALEKVLRAGLDELRAPLVREEIRRKYDVLIGGSWKRGKMISWLYYIYKKSLV